KSGLALGDRILRIGGVSVGGLSLEAATEKLKGKTGTPIDMEVVSLNDKPRTLTLTRQPIQASVADHRMLDAEGIAYLQVSTFHENTLAELDAALVQLEMQGMRSLILDL